MGYPEGTPEALISQGLLAHLQPTEAHTKDGSSPTQQTPGEKQEDAKQRLFMLSAWAMLKSGAGRGRIARKQPPICHNAPVSP